MIDNEDITLRKLINDAFIKGSGRAKFGRNPVAREKEAQNMCDWFETYYGGTDEESELTRIKILDTPLQDIRKY